MQLLNDEIFNPWVIHSYGDLLNSSQYIGSDLLDFGTKMDAITNCFEYFMLDYSLEEINTLDKAEITKMIKKGVQIEVIAKNYLIQEKKRLVE